MPPAPELETQLNCYIDGTAAAVDVARLDTLLRGDEAAHLISTDH
jgi:hypothetical protein